MSNAVMNVILTKPTSRELTVAAEANYIAYFASFTCLPHCTFSQSAEFTWVLVKGAPGITVLHTDLALTQADRRIAEQLQFLTSMKQGQSGCWQVLPTCSPPNLGQLLLKHGLTTTAGCPAMTLDLDTLPTEVILPREVRIECVSDETVLKDWLIASAASAEGDVTKVKTYFDVYVYLLQHPQSFNAYGSFYHYVGYLRGQPVTSSTLLFAGGLAGLYDVSTAPQARRQGLGRLICLAPLLDARKLGYCYAVLQSSDKGQPLYEQLGFTELYREENYMWHYNA
jgi:ribosomal protein S18 acetylase RimI-like enzyme